MNIWDLDFCPEYLACEESKLDIDFDDYFDCGIDSCNDIEEWGYFHEIGDFCYEYSGIDEYFLEYCEDEDNMYA